GPTRATASAQAARRTSERSSNRSSPARWQNRGVGDRRHAERHRRVAVFAMPEAGHFQRLRPLVAALAGRGFEVTVFTHRDFEAATARAGGRFADLFGRYPIEDADGESLPVPCRFVTFAACYAEPLRRELESLRPAL